MNTGPIIASVLYYLCTMACCCLWPGAIVVMIARYNALSTIERLQSRLQAWAALGGNTIVRQERPAQAPLGCAMLYARPLSWFVSPRDSPWAFEYVRGSFGTRVSSCTTRVVLRDRRGRLRQGRMQYVGSALGGLRWSVWSRWEEEDAPRPWPEPVPPGPTPPDPRDDPLWDRWIDDPGVG